MGIAIRVENLGKKYFIRHKTGERYTALRDVLANAVKNTGRRVLSGLKQVKPVRKKREDFWALQDINFEVKEGERLGIIGRNGAGKSTLLKILSRITEPTTGRALINGRIASLLEVGTGFHPELTGRENIFLNGAILGMRKSEIKQKFDEIVDFAGIETFLDTPVKRFSSGMYVRLAFSVAANLETDILLIDEVLAVGDASFQRKSLGKMSEVAKSGRTVFFVSHQMNSIRKLCERCIWLDGGRMQMAASTIEVVSAYEAFVTSSIKRNIREQDTHLPARFLGWEIVYPKAEHPNILTTLEQIEFKIIVQINTPVLNGVHGIALWNSDNQLMWAWAIDNLKLSPGVHEFIYTLPGLPLRPGIYSWHVSLYDGGELLDVWYCLPELIIATAPLTHPRDEWSGVLNIPCKFNLH